MNIVQKSNQFKRIQSWMGSSLPAGFAWLPDSVDTGEFYQYNGCVELVLEGDMVVEMTPNVPVWQAWQATLPDATIAKAEQVRSERDSRLSACDWTQMADVPLTEEEKTAWMAYRQGLRDVPEQAGFPEAVIWPVVPA